jgi:pyrroloquinoline quinone biosynthesis protein B
MRHLVALGALAGVLIAVSELGLRSESIEPSCGERGRSCAEGGVRGAKPRDQDTNWEVVVLGIAQDAGIPHLGCNRGICLRIRAGERKAERVASIGVVNVKLGKAYLFDATPDFVSQVHSLTGGRPPDAIFLTHGHIGHYTGLMFLGRESIDASNVPVYGTERMGTLLRSGGPWSQLVSRNNIDLHLIGPDRPIDLGDGLRVTAFVVPHRDEFTDTLGFLIEGPRKRALFVPDIDQWQKWSRDVRQLAETVDLALVDGTFASADEIPGRSIADIPHPLMPATRELFRGTRALLRFIHINHTNQEIDASDVVKDGFRFPI